MNKILEINVKITGFNAVECEARKIVMIEFEAEADCESFKGKTVAKGCDTQTIDKSGMRLSARYMLEGVDCDGLPCRIFIENNGRDMLNCTPKIVTDSKALSFLMTSDLKAEVTPADGGVTVKIFVI
ncbi:MAG: hypothetical protein IJ424_03170 [Oscillospiraceae bacterium]|nr:hypothetical protein [Oscillospiraceae bacterium]